MIIFKPKNLTESTVKFTACEDDVNFGYCLMKTDENFAEVYELDYNKDKPYIVEGLLRSSFNYASLRNIYMGKCSCVNITEFLDKMNFEKHGECYINDIPSILMGSCCK